jgi:small-conductance mechanosensitive channel
LLFQLYIAACIANAVITIVSFFLYVRTRLAPREQLPGDTAEQQGKKLDGLDRREQRYQSIHFITLALFVLFGVLILVQLSGKLNHGTII